MYTLLYCTESSLVTPDFLYINLFDNKQTSTFMKIKKMLARKYENSDNLCENNVFLSEIEIFNCLWYLCFCPLKPPKRRIVGL